MSNYQEQYEAGLVTKEELMRLVMKDNTSSYEDLEISYRRHIINCENTFRKARRINSGHVTTEYKGEIVKVFGIKHRSV